MTPPPTLNRSQCIGSLMLNSKGQDSSFEPKSELPKGCYVEEYYTTYTISK